MSTEKTTEHLEEYTVAELVDDALEAGVWNPYMRNRYVYEFQQGSRRIRGLTAEAIAHIALANGISIESTTREDMDEGVLYTAVAIKHDADGRVLRAEGVAYEAYENNGRPDKFCWQKALTKASRNARRQLIPANLQISAIETLLQLDPPPAKPLPAHTRVVEKLPAVKQAEVETFEVFKTKKAALIELGIEPELFWESVKGVFDVENRDDMSVEDWTDLKSALTTEGFANWIRSIALSDDDTDTEMELPATDTTQNGNATGTQDTGALPF